MGGVPARFDRRLPIIPTASPAPGHENIPRGDTVPKATAYRIARVGGIGTRRAAERRQRTGVWESAVAAETYRIGSGRGESLSLRINDQTQRFQGLHAQDGLINFADQDRRRGLASVNLDNGHIGLQPNGPPIRKANPHRPSRPPDPQLPRQVRGDNRKGRASIHQHPNGDRLCSSEADLLVDVTHRAFPVFLPQATLTEGETRSKGNYPPNPFTPSLSSKVAEANQVFLPPCIFAKAIARPVSEATNLRKARAGQLPAVLTE